MALEEHAPIPLPTCESNAEKSEEQMNTTDDFAPKVRKPYTITKQRERWTDDEHKKFLEALKLYGRAWRKIEEHIGTKTAVQIRSHAQKFFSKVARESNTSGGDRSSVKPIEIPPPRPKRKPMHPYPRKHVSPHKTGTTFPEPDNQSPMSVLLSAVGSDSSDGAESSMPMGSPLSVSSVVAISDSEAHKPIFKGVKQDENLSSYECIPPPVLQQELEVSSHDTVFVQEYHPGESTIQSLKLFGKTLVVVDPRNRGEQALKLPIQDDPLPCLTLCNSSTEVHSPTPIKARPLNDEQKEKVTANATPLFPSSCKLTALGKHRRNGFVPYKRCFSEQEKGSEDREQQQQRIRVCL